MSGNIYIEPRNRKKKLISEQLKYILQRTKSFPLKVDDNNLIYFQALRDAGIEEAQDVVLYIEKYGECEINIEY